MTSPCGHVGPFTSGDPWAGTPSNTDDVTFDKVTSRVALQRQFTDDVMGYVSYRKGSTLAKPIPSPQEPAAA